MVLMVYENDFPKKRMQNAGGRNELMNVGMMMQAKLPLVLVGIFS